MAGQLAQLRGGENNPLSARSRSSQIKRTVRIGVGLLPYIAIASVWRRRRPVFTSLASSRNRLCFDTSSCRIVPLADLANAIPRSSYLFGASWPAVRRTLVATVEQNGDPYAVMIPTAEIIRFYYATSTRLAQALFWGEYDQTFNAGRSGVFDEGMVRVHLRRWLEDQDAWTLARYLSSPVMQREARRLYQSLQLCQLNSPTLMGEPDQALPCGFPFEGPTTVQGIFVRVPGATPDSSPRWLILQLERCSAPFPFHRVVVERDNDSARGENAEDENLMPAWAKAEESESEVEKLAPNMFQSNEEPRRGLEPLRIELIEDRFEYPSGKTLIKDEKIVQRYRFLPMKTATSQRLTGLGTGQGTWGASDLQLTKLTTVPSPVQKRREVPVLPASLETFVQAIESLAKQRQPYEVRLIGVGEGDTTFGGHTLASFPTHDSPKGKRIAWAWIKREKRARRVAIAEIRSGNKVAYALEIERTNQQHAILVITRSDWQEIGPSEWQVFLLLCARRRGWALEDQLPGYRRKTTTHRELVSIAVLESRIWRKITEMFKHVGSP